MNELNELLARLAELIKQLQDGNGLRIGNAHSGRSVDCNGKSVEGFR